MNSASYDLFRIKKNTIMKDKTFSEFIEPLPMKEGNGIDLTAKLKSCNNTAGLEPVSNNLANLNVNPSCLTETSTSSISSTMSTTSSQSQTETSNSNTQQTVSCADIHVDVQKESTDRTQEDGNSSADLSESELKVKNNTFKGLVSTNLLEVLMRQE